MTIDEDISTGEKIIKDGDHKAVLQPEAEPKKSHVVVGDRDVYTTEENHVNTGQHRLRMPRRARGGSSTRAAPSYSGMDASFVVRVSVSINSLKKIKTLLEY